MQFMDQRRQLNLTSTPEFVLNATQPQRAQQYNVDNTGYYESSSTTKTPRSENILHNCMDTTAVAQSVRKMLINPSSQYGTNFHEFVTPGQNEPIQRPSQNGNASRRLSHNGNRTYTPASNKEYCNNSQSYQPVYQVCNSIPNGQINELLSSNTWGKQPFPETTNITHQTNTSANFDQVQHTFKCRLNDQSNNAYYPKVLNSNNLTSSSGNNTGRSNVFNYNSNDNLRPFVQSRNVQAQDFQQKHVIGNTGNKPNKFVHPDILSASKQHNQLQPGMGFGYSSGLSTSKTPQVDIWSRQTCPHYSKAIFPRCSRFPPPTQSAKSYFSNCGEPRYSNMLRQKSNAESNTLPRYVTKITQSTFEELLPHNASLQGTATVQPVATQAVPTQSLADYSSAREQFQQNFSQRQRNVKSDVSPDHVTNTTSFPLLSAANYFSGNISKHENDPKSEDLRIRNPTETPASHDVLNHENKLNSGTNNTVEQTPNMLMGLSDTICSRNVGSMRRDGSVSLDRPILQHALLPEWTQSGVSLDSGDHTMVGFNDKGICSGKDDFGIFGFINDRQSTSSNDSGFQGDIVSPEKLNISKKFKNGEFEQSSLSPDSYSPQELIEKMETVEQLFHRLKESYVRKCLIQKINDSEDQFKNELQHYLRSKLATIMEKVAEINTLEKWLKKSKTADSKVAISDDNVFTNMVAESSRENGPSSLFKADLVVVENESTSRRNQIEQPNGKTNLSEVSNNGPKRTSGLDCTAHFEPHPFVMLSALTAMKDIGINMSGFSTVSGSETPEKQFVEQPLCKSSMMKSTDSQRKGIGDCIPGLKNRTEHAVELSNPFICQQHEKENITNETFTKVRLQSLEEWHSDISDAENDEIMNSSVQFPKGSKTPELNIPNPNIVNTSKATVSGSVENNILNDSAQRPQSIDTLSGLTRADENYFERNETHSSVTVKENIMSTFDLPLKKNDNLQQIETIVRPKCPTPQNCVQKSTDTSKQDNHNIAVNSTKFLNKIILKKVNKSKTPNPSCNPNTLVKKNHLGDEDEVETEHWIISSESSKMNAIEESESKICTRPDLDRSDKLDNGSSFYKSGGDDSTISNINETVDRTHNGDKTAFACERKLSSESNSSYLSILSIREEMSLETENKKIEDIDLATRQSTPELSSEEFIADTCLFSDDENTAFEDTCSEKDTFPASYGASMLTPTLQDTIDRLEKRLMTENAIPKDTCTKTRCCSKLGLGSIELSQTTEYDRESRDDTESERCTMTIKRKISPQEFRTESSDEEFNFVKRLKTSSFNRKHRLKRRASRMAQPDFPLITELPHKPVPYHKKSKNTIQNTQICYYSAMWSLASMGALSTNEKILKK